MIPCPSCNQECIPAWRYFLSSALFPQKCSACSSVFGMQGFLVGSGAAITEALLLSSAALFFINEISYTVFGLIALWASMDLVIGCVSNPKELPEAKISEAQFFVGVIAVVFVIAIVFIAVQIYL